MFSQPPSPPPPPPGFIHLVLSSPEENNPFYLEIPTSIVATVCLSPRKYLRYLGWCVLGVIGVLNDEQGKEIALDGELVDQGDYHNSVSGPNVLFAHAVDLEVIKQRSHGPSESTSIESREEFRTRILARDGFCVWTGFEMPVAMHIIPHRRGDEWLRSIIDNRPHDENLSTLTSVDNIRNGICAIAGLHDELFDPRKVVVLKTPNPILRTTDIPNRHQRDIPAEASYPTKSRYTFQWIVTTNENNLRVFPNNNDATFKNQRLRKPADLLLHYNYGAAAAKQWGKNNRALTHRPGIPRPSAPIPVAMGPTRGKHSRNITIGKRTAGTHQGGQASGSKRKRTGGGADLEVQDKWDEDDVMLFFWGDSKAARKRHAQKEQERTAYLEDWRTAVTAGNPDIV